MDDIPNSSLDPGITESGRSAISHQLSPNLGPPSTAKHGGGPHTPEGKQAVSANALSHGITSAKPVIKGESSEEWEAHHQAIRDQLQPVGHYEDMLAYQVALEFWQLARVGRYQLAVTQNRLEALDDPEPIGMASPGAPQAPDPSSMGPLDPKPLLRLVAELDELDDDTPLDSGDVAMVLVAIPVGDGFRWPGVPAGSALYEVKGWTAGWMRACVDAAAKHQHIEPAEVLRAASEDIVSLGRATNHIRARARCERDVQVEQRRRRRERAERVAILPTPEVHDRIVRYSTHHQRAIERFMKLLETSQRARNGTLPPPIRVELTGG